MSMNDTTSRGSSQTVATSETGDLIAASKVEGTNVYDRRGEKIGSVFDVMIEKRSGQVSYAILSFGGFLGLGENYYPLPWNQLTYDTSMGGYVTDLDETRLKGAPSYGFRDAADWQSQDYQRQVDQYYGVPASGRATSQGL